MSYGRNYNDYGRPRMYGGYGSGGFGAAYGGLRGGRNQHRDSQGTSSHAHAPLHRKNIDMSPGLFGFGSYFNRGGGRGSLGYPGSMYSWSRQGADGSRSARSSQSGSYGSMSSWSWGGDTRGSRSSSRSSYSASWYPGTYSSRSMQGEVGSRYSRSSRGSWY